MPWIFKESKWVLFSHNAGVNDVRIGGRFLVYLSTRLIVQVKSGSTEFLWSISSLGLVALILIEG